MRICKVRIPDGTVRVGIVEGDVVRIMSGGPAESTRSLQHILHSGSPAATARELAGDQTWAAAAVAWLAPIDDQEVWGAGVTYERSQIARREESEGAGSFYDKVYVADRPELFFKATPSRVVGPGEAVRLRGDTQWCVPEPELALVISPRLEIVGYTIGDDVSCRDIEGENPLYLPQAKFFEACCALGPVITLAEAMPPLQETVIELEIRRAGAVACSGSTELSRMARTPEDLVSWLGREQSFPDGVILLTGTGIVPPDEFSLREGDEISISITGIGTLTTGVACRGN